MFMVGNQFCSPLESGPVNNSTYTEYSAQIAANTLFCCACSLQTPKILVESGMDKRMLNLIQLSVRDDLALRYVPTQVLSHNLHVIFIPREGDSNIKRKGVLIRNFEKTPKRY